MELIPIESTAKAAKMAMIEENSAAICANVAAKMYNLPILFKNIEDCSNNKTRFFIISNFENLQSADDKTSMLVYLSNTPGSLVDFLNDFERCEVNLTKIKSHIVEGKSIFFIEFNGHQKDLHIMDIMDRHAKLIKVLGSYVKENDDI